MIQANIDKKMMEVLDNISDGCFLLNKKMEFEYFNKAGEIITNKPRELLVNQCIWDVLPAYTPGTPMYDNFYTAMNEQAVQIFETVSEYTGKPLEVRVFPNKEGLLIIYSDITKRKQHEQQQKYYDQLKIIAEMSAGVAHEVRNPMTTIKGFMQLLKQNDDLQKYDGIFNLVIDEVNRVNDIISNFLDISRDRPTQLEQSQLNEIIKVIYPLLEIRALKEGKYILLELGDIPLLAVEKNEIRQLLLNMINNSLDAMQKGETVTIKTSVTDYHVVLSIMDEGCGIPSEIMDKISLPFVTSKAHGTGLGLSICYAIAKRNNAEIQFESNEKGTKFDIRFKRI